MDRLKKLNGSMIAAIVLSVLLIMSVTAGATLAWFASRDSASTSLTMGEAVVVTIGEDYKQGDSTLAMTLPVDTTTGGLLPGMAITPNVRVHLQESNTNALLRARFITTVEFPNEYMDAAYEDLNKYPNSASFTGTSGKVLDDYNVYAGTIDYVYYDYLGNEDTAKTKHGVVLSRVEVRDEIVNQIGSGTFTINGVEVSVTADNAAMLEIRQRGVDLTNAINRVLAGQRGFGINPETGEVVDSEGVGVKYTRRVADGWAYREADQCWYYMGSQTNGFVFTETANATYDPSVDKYASEDALISTTPAAKDITAYTATQVGNVSVQRPTYETWTPTLDNGTDKSRNYLGGTKDDAAIDKVANESAVLANTSMASVDLSQGNVQIDFLTKRFVLPTFINNNYAQATVSFTFTVEAIQDYLIDPLQEATSAADRVPNNLVNAIMVFNNAFPQTLREGGTEAALADTGTVANIIPGGGTSVSWDTSSGTSTVKYGKKVVTEAGLTEGGLYGYGYLENATITGTGVKGFGTKTDEYGDVVADYTKSSEWQRGTASSLGVNPAGTLA